MRTLSLLITWVMLAIPLQAADRTYAVSVPIPSDISDAAHIAELENELLRIRAELPRVTQINYFLLTTSTPSDWRAILDATQRMGYTALVGFAEFHEEGGHEGFRPQRAGGAWNLGPIGALLADPGLAGHPALIAVALLDEPWHPEKLPIYPTRDLLTLYSAAKAAQPPDIDVPLLVSFSRQLWRNAAEGRATELTYWTRGICDIVQISALEFQNQTYQSDLLDSNHYWSRKVIHDATPDIPIWTTVQVFGGKYGPSGGYWFPRERFGEADLRRLLDDVTSERYESVQPLAGIVFQNWASVHADNAPHQYTLGDEDPGGTPVSQRDAATDARAAIRNWWADIPTIRRSRGVRRQGNP